MNKTPIGKNILITALVGIISLIFIVIVFTKNYNKLIETRKINVHQAGEYLSNNFRKEVVKNIQALHDLKGRIEFTNGHYLQNWHYDAQVIRQHSPSFMFIEWIDSDMVIQKIEPLEGNEQALGTNIGNLGYRAPNWIRASKDTILNFTEWLQLIQGPKGFLVDAPVYFEGKFQGTITAGMNFNSLFDELVNENNEYYVTLSDHTNTIFYSSNDSDGINDYKDYTYTNSFKVTDHLEPWTITVQPNSNISNRAAFQQVGIGLALGLILSFLLTLSVFFILQSKSAEKQLQKLNQDLIIQKNKAEASSQAKSIFLSTMSHEIRTPLSGIMGLIGL